VKGYSKHNFLMIIFSDLQTDFSHKLTILTKILLGNLCWLVSIIIREFKGHCNSGLGTGVANPNWSLGLNLENLPKNWLFGLQYNKKLKKYT
jgi:hypothetical protein